MDRYLLDPHFTAQVEFFFHFVGPLIAPILDFLWPSPWVSKPGWFFYLHSYLLAHGEPKGHIWCCICLFHQLGVHCISVYTAASPSGEIVEIVTCGWYTYHTVNVLNSLVSSLKAAQKQSRHICDEKHVNNDIMFPLRSTSAFCYVPWHISCMCTYNILKTEVQLLLYRRIALT